MNKKSERAFLIGVNWGNESQKIFSESMQELRALAKTAKIIVAEDFAQNLKKPNSATYIGKGKLTEIKNQAQKIEVNTLIFNNNLSPSQSRNISDISGCNVVDRTELILDIFAKHARTKQAKLQVELAQLEYAYTKLKRLWKHLSRIQGGIGFRGPGETQIEVDRREIQKKTTHLKKQLETIEQVSKTKRKKRSNKISIALVGYTNAGKSTLFNLLTNEKRFVADQLFATLDSKTRALISQKSEQITLTDTIGFIRKLPHKLVKSFHSTLLEVLEADLLFHVVDVSHSNLDDIISSVTEVLEEIGVENKNVLMVFNKIDKVTGVHSKFVQKKLLTEFPDSVIISAKTGEGIEELKNKIEEFLDKMKVETYLEIPFALSKLISFVYEKADILVEETDSKENIVLKIKIHRQYLGKIKKQIEDFELKKYINK